MLSAKSWKLEGIALLVATILVCISTVTLLQAAVQHFAGKGSFDDGSLLLLIFGSLALHGSILVGAGLFLWWHKVTWTEAFGFSTPYLWRAVLLGFVAALVFVPVGSMLQGISLKTLTWLHFATPPQEAVAEFHKADSLISRAYLAAFAIVLAPFAEEVLFRGILYTGLKQIGYPKMALWMSAIIFAAIHHSAAIFLPLLLLGLVLAWLYEQTSNLIAPITAHAVFNAINVAFLFLGDQQIQEQTLRHLQ